ncbi:thermonuclease family protein [Ruegeria arenilitoris]|uniref:thermonuclease family protein n=1 Tax=Ruegeria arenilitoris TaxID=1173585 RepID=UPI00147AFA16|nr:thermonuclease family protein [Ruegeria arenilitoris]
MIDPEARLSATPDGLIVSRANDEIEVHGVELKPGSEYGIGLEIKSRGPNASSLPKFEHVKQAEFQIELWNRVAGVKVDAVLLYYGNRDRFDEIDVFVVPRRELVWNAAKGRAYIIDGDTICIKGTKIRLAGIDAPELDQPWGQKSKWAMVNICKGQIITAELDGERSYDRLVGTCYLPDGRDIGAELIKLGLALDLPRFSMGKYRHLEPQGARQRLGNGRFGHASIRFRQQTTVTIQKR